MTKHITAIGIVAAALLWASAARAGDCAYYRTALAEARKSCNSTGECRLIPNMEQMVEAECHLGSGGGTGGGFVGGAPDGSSEEDPTHGPLPQTAYEGEACQFFHSESSIEHRDGGVTLNYYGDDTMVCHDQIMFQCKNGRWKKLGWCRTYQNWESMRSEVRERSSYGK